MANVDKNYLNFDFGGEMFSFFISDEDGSIINTSEIKEYDEKAKELTDASLDVIRDNMFGSVDIRALSEAYAFVPFNYQIDNVTKMLNRFRGRGVFGDQVGLGKTVESLMTAHAMFAAGSIRNALFIVGKKTIPGWVNEILMKFPHIFKIHIASSALKKDGSVKEDIDFASVKNIAKKHPDAIEIIDFSDDSVEEISNEGCAPDFRRLIERMKQDNSNVNNRDRFRIYIATEAMLRASDGMLNDMSHESGELRTLDGEMDPYIRDAIQGIARQLDSLSIIHNSQVDFCNVFSNCNRGDTQKADITYDKLLDDIETFSSLSAARLLRDTLTSKIDVFTAQKPHRVPELSRKKKNLEVLEPCVQRINDIIASLEERYNEVKESTNIFFNERIIDLMVIDEVHQLYKPGSDRDSTAGMAYYLSRINKKFCVLISATPVRTKLDDIFELLYIANPKMFGSKSDNDAKEYFYQTMCRISSSSEYKNSAGTRFPLADMVMDDKDISEEKLKVFLGLVNGFFTRKRISDVSEDMSGIYMKSFSELDRPVRNILEAISYAIIEKRSIMYMKRGRVMTETESLDIARKEWDAWHRSTPDNISTLFYDIAKGECGPSDESIIEKTRCNKCRHFFAAIDSTLIEIIKVIDELSFKKYQGTFKKNQLKDVNERLLVAISCAFRAYKKSNSNNSDIDRIDAMLADEEGLRGFKRQLYSIVNWQRRDKFGIAFIPDNSYEQRLAESYGGPFGARARNVIESLEDAVSNSTYKTSGGVFIYPKSENPTSEYDDDFLISLLYDTVMAYFSKDSDENTTGGARAAAMDAMRDVSDEKIRDNANFTSRFGDKRRVGLEKELGKNNGDLSCGEEVNRVAFVDGNYQAGVNLQQYKSFIFYQMDSMARKLLSPVDIEQWIGRIHRTGQVKNCRILTVIDHYTRTKFKPEFLLWYYSILSDRKGLDLYGNNTPDVAFIQPIVSDCVRRELRARNSRLGNLSNMDFITLLQKCYDYDEKNKLLDTQKGMTHYLKTCIRKLCRVPGFGRA